jgi:hypothetical protein
VALLQVLLPAGERRYLRDCGITTLPLAQLNAVLAPLGSVIVGTKTRSADRFVLCTDARGEVERYGLFELRRVEDGRMHMMPEARPSREGGFTQERGRGEGC